MVKLSYWGGVLLAVLVPPGGFLWLPGAWAEFPGPLPESLCALHQVQSGSPPFFLTGLTMPSNCHLSAASVGSSLFSMTVGFLAVPVKSDSWRLRNRCCRTFKLISCIPHCVVVVFHLEWRLGALGSNMDESDPSVLVGKSHSTDRKCVHTELKPAKSRISV